MVTYKSIQFWVKLRYGRVMQSCWIADVKARNGLPMRSTRTTPRKKPCPPQWQPVIEEAMRHFGWL